ncbi:MAG: hypothetical protein A2583_05175 [Bdellovibrionales bacterium RIFOXYD1_FULL_53_11]|nr:MAG: hypothetical protein A2583_05175 [Bdellovibrionales bacterium RIFOXYD1_FULL_53_11]
MKSNIKFIIMVTLASLVLSGCAHAPYGKNADALKTLENACRFGKDLKTVRGTAIVTAKSKDASGRFSALVEAAGTNSLKLEITNILGGTEALITINNGRYSIKLADGKSKPVSGNGSWGGIPLNWASNLFIGRFPCPERPEDLEKPEWTADGHLRVSTKASLHGDAEIFLYRFRKHDDSGWPESLRWERKGVFGVSVEFVFDNPEKTTGAPLKWQARSKLGEVGVKWRERDAK